MSEWELRAELQECARLLVEADRIMRGLVKEADVLRQVATWALDTLDFIFANNGDLIQPDFRDKTAQLRETAIAMRARI